jgi:hypothetical protein
MQADEEGSVDERTDTDPELLQRAGEAKSQPAEPSHREEGSDHPPGHHEPGEPDDGESSEGAVRRGRAAGGER